MNNLFVNERITTQKLNDRFNKLKNSVLENPIPFSPDDKGIPAKIMASYSTSPTGHYYVCLPVAYENSQGTNTTILSGTNLVEQQMDGVIYNQTGTNTGTLTSTNITQALVALYMGDLNDVNYKKSIPAGTFVILHSLPVNVNIEDEDQIDRELYVFDISNAEDHYLEGKDGAVGMGNYNPKKQSHYNVLGEVGYVKNLTGAGYYFNEDEVDFLYRPNGWVNPLHEIPDGVNIVTYADTNTYRQAIVANTSNTSLNGGAGGAYALVSWENPNGMVYSGKAFPGSGIMHVPCYLGKQEGQGILVYGRSGYTNGDNYGIYGHSSNHTHFPEPSYTIKPAERDGNLGSHVSTMIMGYDYADQNVTDRYGKWKKCYFDRTDIPGFLTLGRPGLAQNRNTTEPELAFTKPDADANLSNTNLGAYTLYIGGDGLTTGKPDPFVLEWQTRAQSSFRSVFAMAGTLSVRGSDSDLPYKLQMAPSDFAGNSNNEMIAFQNGALKINSAKGNDGRFYLPVFAGSTQTGVAGIKVNGQTNITAATGATGNINIDISVAQADDTNNQNFFNVQHVTNTNISSYITVITAVDFGAQTTTTQRINFDSQGHFISMTP
jgi:hypothetical protein